ncbi:hypothetical protein P9305_08240 [Lysinibacillus capsici]|uniref:hypothetical protein n=1 Tax=Lysinibacillus capsici TaxID=2115968 RepID=UPI002E22CFCC|nr:hypothetical protein [Lysinibacillus capsici]
MANLFACKMNNSIKKNKQSGFESEASTLNQRKSGSGSKVITSSKEKIGFEQKMITSSKEKIGFEQKMITSSKEKIGFEKNDHFKPKKEQLQSKNLASCFSNTSDHHTRKAAWT